jgi:LAO/AO transport system kinase
MRAELDAALGFDKRALGKLITAVEDSRPEGRARRRQVAEALADASFAPVVGITGAPGVGKSTLVSALCQQLLVRDAEQRIAVVAVDPTSAISGGSVLGDRTRLQVPTELQARLFFRSQPSSLALGGLSPRTFQVVRTLQAVADLVIVESVGVGQSEVDICHLSDLSVLLVGPQSGDEIQLMKAGIVEMPGLFVAAKADLEDAASAARLARTTSRPVLEVSARTGHGVGELADAVARCPAPGAAVMAARAEYFFERWVERRYGQVGLEALRAGIATSDGFEDRQQVFEDSFPGWLAGR